MSMATYVLNLRSGNEVIQRQTFTVDDDLMAKDVAAAVFHATDQWDSFDLWQGSRLVGGPIVDKLERVAANIEEVAVAVEEAVQAYGKFANDPKLAARIREIRNKQAKPALSEEEFAVLRNLARGNDRMLPAIEALFAQLGYLTEAHGQVRISARGLQRLAAGR